MIKLKDLLNENERKEAERALKQMRPHAKKLGFDEVDQRAAEKRYGGSFDSAADGNYVGGFIKGEYDHVFVFDDGWVNFTNGGTSGNDGVDTWTKWNTWDHHFGLGSEDFEGPDGLRYFMNDWPEKFGKYVKKSKRGHKEYHDVPIRLFKDLGYDKSTFKKFEKYTDGYDEYITTDGKTFSIRFKQY